MTTVSRSSSVVVPTPGDDLSMSVQSNRLSNALFLVTVVVFLIFATIEIVHSRLPSVSGSLVMPLIIYGLAHLLRALRLGVLLNAGRARLLLEMYFFTAACSAVIPFKLGELVRINEIGRWSGSFWRGLLIVWIERAFDVTALGVMALIIIGTDTKEVGEIASLLWAIGGFVFLTIVFFFIVPEQLCGLNLHVIRNYKGRKAVHILRILDSCYQMFDQVRPLLAGKLVTLSLLTLFIWCAELVAVAMLLESGTVLGAMTSLASWFARVLSGSGSATDSATSFEDVKMLALIAAGTVALAFYARVRVQANGGIN